MKLKFTDLDLTFQLQGNPSINCSADSQTVNTASFDLIGLLPTVEGEDPTQFLSGHFIWCDDDEEFTLREFDVEDFNHYDVSEMKHDPELDPNGIDHTYIFFDVNEKVDPIIPDPPVYDPEVLLADARNRKMYEISDISNRCVELGIIIDTEYGEERFRLEERDKTMLLAIYAMVQGGMTQFPYHSMNTATNNICVVYSDADIAKIATAAFAFITFHESYANMLVQWLNRETDLDVINGIYYGIDLPEDLQQYIEIIMASAAVGDTPEAIMAMLPKNMPTSGSTIILPDDYAAMWRPVQTTPEEETPEVTE